MRRKKGKNRNEKRERKKWELAEVDQAVRIKYLKVVNPSSEDSRALQACRWTQEILFPAAASMPITPSGESHPCNPHRPPETGGNPKPELKAGENQFNSYSPRPFQLCRFSKRLAVAKQKRQNLNLV